MQLHCESCNNLIPAEDIDLGTTLAKCRACNTVMNFGSQLGVQARGETARTRSPVPQPASFRVEETGNGIRITWRWFAPAFLFLLFFCIAWDSFLVFWYSMAFGTNAPWIFKVFPIAHLAVGIGLTYFTLSGFLNRTVIELTPELLKVEHGPLPWPGNRTLPVLDVDQLYCKDRFQPVQRGRPSLTYQVCALLKDGRTVTLLSWLTERDQALFVEQTLEKWLGIPDRPVGGELSR